MLDIAITEDGDLLIDAMNKDLYAIGTDDLRAQMAMCRIKSIKKDWFIDHIGSDLEEILGMPSTVATQKLGADKIFQALTIDSLFNVDEIYIVAESSNHTSINYQVYLKNINKDSAILIEVDLDLVKGINTKIGE